MTVTSVVEVNGVEKDVSSLSITEQEKLSDWINRTAIESLGYEVEEVACKCPCSGCTEQGQQKGKQR